MGAGPKYIDVFSLPPPPREAEFHDGVALLPPHPVRLRSDHVLRHPRHRRVELAAGLRDRRRARTAPARILAKEDRPGQKRTLHYVRFAFTPEGGSEIQAETAATPEQFASVSEGQELPVHYLPENPAGDDWLFNYEETRTEAYRQVRVYLCAFVPPLLLAAVLEWFMRRERDLRGAGSWQRGASRRRRSRREVKGGNPTASVSSSRCRPGRRSEAGRACRRSISRRRGGPAKRSGCCGIRGGRAAANRCRGCGSWTFRRPAGIRRRSTSVRRSSRERGGLLAAQPGLPPALQRRAGPADRRGVSRADPAAARRGADGGEQRPVPAAERREDHAQQVGRISRSCLTVLVQLCYKTRGPKGGWTSDLAGAIAHRPAAKGVTRSRGDVPAVPGRIRRPQRFARFPN